MGLRGGRPRCDGQVGIYPNREPWPFGNVFRIDVTGMGSPGTNDSYAIILGQQWNYEHIGCSS